MGKPLLCYVTDRRSLACPSGENLIEPLLAKIEAVAAAGIHWIQIREKDLPGKEIAALARKALSVVSKHATHAKPPARVLVNDRLDVALAEQSGGVHLGENSLPVTEARRFLRAPGANQPLPPDFLVGVSCHSLEAARFAAAEGADYVFFGPVFATPSKAVYGAPQGLDCLAEVCRAVNIPVIAIGGITPTNIANCMAAGAAGIAAIHLFQAADDPAAAVSTIRRQFSSSTSHSA
ncbi:MAG: thiamine phosphate synthase [Candidatus Acidiferrum sp.]|jgi:thiamine-phosphate pyrophosphorylase